MACLTENEILAQNGRVIKNSDGTISVYTINNATGQLSPTPLNKICCEALSINGAYFDNLTQKCRWGTQSDCSFSNNFNLVINPVGSDGANLFKNKNEEISLEVSFDYLFKFNGKELTNFLSNKEYNNCENVIDIFESIGASLVLNKVVSNNGNYGLTNVFETTIFDSVGSGNLYNYLKESINSNPFYICGSSALTDTSCSEINIYDLSNQNTITCSTPVSQLVQSLFDQSGISSTATTVFRNTIKGDIFNPNWVTFTTTIDDQELISNILNNKIKFSIKLSGVCVDMCLLLDNIKLNKVSNNVTSKSIFVSKSPSFELDKIIDNKKSWVKNTSNTRRTYSISNINNNTTIRDTDYYLDHADQIINTKEISLDLDIADAIESDLFNFIKNNPCLLTGGTIGTTTCVKLASEIVNFGTVYTSITSNTVVVTSTTTTTFCPVGYSATPANDSCVQIVNTAATFNGSGSTIIAGDKATDYGQFGAFFYPEIQNNGALPVYYVGAASNLLNQTGGTITPVTSVNNSFWGNPTSSASVGRLNNVGLSASSTEYLGFTYCLNIVSGGTYYVGIGADNLCRFTLNGKLLVDFNLTVQDSFKKWSVFPVTLNSGNNVIEMYGKNNGAQSSFGAEIYAPTSLSALTAATTTGITGANVIFSTANFIGGYWTLGSTVGYSCPSGYALNGCGSSYYCTKQVNTGFTTGTSVVYSSVTLSGVAYSTATTEVIVCTPRTYCCSQYCGDANINIEALITTDLSKIETFEDYKYIITSELVDAKNRKTISNYATLRMLYDRYLNSNKFCGIQSSGFDYKKIDNFTKSIGDYWNDLIEQIIPTTTIWGSTKVYKNTIFDNNKFPYKQSTLLFGDSTYRFLKVSSPSTGYTCDVEIRTEVIEGTTTGTTLFLGNENKNIFNRAFVIQMNSGSEFVGIVNILGPNGRGDNQITECSIRASITYTQPDVGSNNGTATANHVGAYGPVTYLWSNGSTSQTITGLSAGEYSVIIRDTSIPSCTTKATIVLNTKGCAITSSFNVVQPSGNTSNGSLTIVPNGGVAPYTYLWNTLATTNTISSLSAGTYSVTVTDSVGCTTSNSILLSKFGCVLSANTTSTNSTGNTSNGTATATVVAGSSPYTYSWNTSPVKTTATITGLTAGTYTVTITDALSCVINKSVTVSNTPCILSISTTSTGTSSNTGAASVTVNSGYAPYTYSWNTSPVRTTPTITGLTAGTYTVTVTDNFGCTQSSTVSVSSTACTLTAVTTTTNSTGNTANGTATVTASSGTAPYTYSWNTSPVRTTTTITGLTAGTYTVTVSDSSGCFVVKTATVSNTPCILNANVTTTPTTLANDGTATVNIVNGYAPYTYLWSNGATTQTITGLSAGTYTVTVTDNFACSQTLTATVLSVKTNIIIVSDPSTDVIVNNVYINGVAATLVSGTMPTTIGGTTTLETDQVGNNQLVEIYYTVTNPNQNLIMIASDNTNYCQDTFFSGIATFNNAVVDNTQDVYILTSLGACV